MTVAAKPENTFISSIHRRIPKKIHKEKMANPYRGGTADCWYSGKKNDLWVEYKYLPSVPQRGIITWERIGLSELQLEWLNERSEEGRNVVVIVGTPDGGVLYRHREWEMTHSCVEFRKRLVSRDDIANFIAEETMGT